MRFASTLRFDGHSEAIPLDVSNLGADAAAGIVHRFTTHTMAAFADTLAGVGGCSHPIRLMGSSQTINAHTGEILSEFSSDQTPLGLLYRACGNRREHVCPACSRIYARDTFEMVRAGIMGGKSVPETVARNPLVFATLTAPSYGHVHRAGGCHTGKPRTCTHHKPTTCNRSHGADDNTIGAPICPACYDTDTAIVWQWHAPELWRRFTIALRRALAAHLGVSDRRLRDLAAVQFVKVAEYQARGAIHFHALIRADGPTGPGSPAPITGQVLADLVTATIPTVTMVASPVHDQDRHRVLRFGAQLDVKIVRAGTDTDDLTAEAVAGYLAKYATKSTGIDPTRPAAHLIALTKRIKALAGLADPDGPYQHLGKWAHMLGFRGHFSTRSRAYSITLGKLRRARTRYARLLASGTPVDTADLEAQLLADDQETTLIIGSWTYQGSGWPSPGDKELADAAAARAREYAQWKAHQRTQRDERN